MNAFKLFSNNSIKIEKIKNILKRRKRYLVYVILLCFFVSVLSLNSSSPSFHLPPSPISHLSSSLIPYLPSSPHLSSSPIPHQTVDYDSMSCGCKRSYPASLKGAVSSLCNEEVSARGMGQRVVSYAVYGDITKETYSKYWGQIEDRAKDVSEKYQGWLMRVYHNVSQEEKSKQILICDLYCRYQHLDFCYTPHIFPYNITEKTKSSPNLLMDDIPRINKNSIIGNSLNLLNLLHKPANKAKHEQSYSDLLIPKMWRFLPMADSTVSEFLVRDVDSSILPREVAAVSQWLEETKGIVHAMRDHTSHNGVILAGMWGASRKRGAKRLLELFHNMVHYPPRNLWDYDQRILHRVVWPDVRDSIIIHDSYFCNVKLFSADRRSLPFPTRRNGTDFVSWGKLRDHERKGIRPCPKACRPRDHQDWVYC